MQQFKKCINEKSFTKCPNLLQSHTKFWIGQDAPMNESDDNDDDSAIFKAANVDLPFQFELLQNIFHLLNTLSC